MADLKTILELAKCDGGKFFVMDEEGEVKLVIMPVEEYQRLNTDADLEKLSARLNSLTEQTEELNRQIIEAQVDEEADRVFGSNLDPVITGDAADTFYIEPIQPEE